MAFRVVLSTPLTDWRTSGIGKAERSRLACGITVCGADDRFELGAAGGATSTGSASGFGARVELGAEGGAASIDDARGFATRLELGAEGVGGATSTTGARGFGADWA